jgi:hypothetical protein
VVTAEDSDKSPGDEGSGSECDLCGGTGVLTWQQPAPTSTGFVVHEMEHPCPRGCSGWWRMPAAERQDAIPESRGGYAAQANEIHWLGRREIEE